MSHPDDRERDRTMIHQRKARRDPARIAPCRRARACASSAAVGFAAAVVLALASAAPLRAADANVNVNVNAVHAAPPFAAWLPASCLAVAQAAEPAPARARYDQSLFKPIVDSPALAAYVGEFTQARQKLAQRIADEAVLDPVLAVELVQAPLSVALLELDAQPDGSVNPVVAIRLELPRALPEALVFEAVSRLVNQPANLKTAAELGLAVPSLTLVETWPTAGGDQGVLTILAPTPWRVAVRGNFALVFRGKRPEAFKAVLDHAHAPAGPGTLWRTPGFQAAWQGVGMQPGAAFLYLNLRRLQAALPDNHIATIWNALGLDSVQDMGLSEGYFGEGLRHTLYFHAPGPRTGLLAALQSKPDAERTVARLPAVGGGATAAHMDLAGFYEELPLLLDALGGAIGLGAWGQGGGGGLAELARQRTVLGVPVRELLETLGNDFAYIAGDDGGVLRFENADIDGFAALVARMEQREGAAFRELATADDFRIRYLNRTREGGTWATPAYCVLGKRDERRGALLLATHPQAIVALLVPTRQVGRFGEDPDFLRVVAGVGAGHDLFVYLDNRDSLARVYTRLLPALNWWTVVDGPTPSAQAAGAEEIRGAALPQLYLRANVPLLGADPGLLPPASVLKPRMFGLGMGVRCDARGIVGTAYSPIGVWGGGVWMMDHLLLSNPTAMGVLAKNLMDWRR